MWRQSVLQEITMFFLTIRNFVQKAHETVDKRQIAILLMGVVLSTITMANAGIMLSENNQGEGSIPYLLLVLSKLMEDFNQESMQLLEESPYNGTALLPLSASYDGPVPTLEEFLPTLRTLKTLKANSTKDIWPWIFLNRMIGYDPAAVPGNSEYIKRINAIDLDNETGARADFERIFVLALQLARELDSPGIVVDLEAYNCHNAIYHMPDLMYILGEGEDVLTGKLRSLGNDLGDLAAETYPRCTIMFLFTSYDLTVTEIAVGLLDRTQELGSGVRVIDGGEMGIGYCSNDLEDLTSKIELREELFSQKFPYPDLFSLGGTIAPYLNRSEVTGFPLGNGPQIKVLRDFEPLFHELFEAFDLIWVYASGTAGYRPFDPEIGPSFSEGLKQIISNYKSYGKKSPKIVENIVDKTREAISDAEAAGIDVAPYSQSVEDVLSLSAQDRYPEAYDLATQTLLNAKEACENARRSHAEGLIEEAEELIRLAKEQGIDTSRCELYLGTAKRSLGEGNYDSVESMCACALNLRQEIPDVTLLRFLAYLAAIGYGIHLGSERKG